MKLVDKLLDYIHDGFDKDSQRFAALRVRHSNDAYSYRVEDRVLTGYLAGVQIFSVSLAGYTFRTLANHLATLPDLSVIYLNAEHADEAAGALIDGDGAQLQSNGDILWAYSSLLWMYLDALSSELVEAKARILAMLDQMSIKTADADWLDEWGGYFGVARDPGEIDSYYSNRIIAEVLRPRGNNKAIELALKQHFNQTADVVDKVLWGNPDPGYDGAYTHNGVGYYNSSAAPLYGLFTIVIGYDLLTSGDPPAFIHSVRDFVEKFRDAGTHLYSVALTGSELSDSYTAPPVDSGLALTVTDVPSYNGLRVYDGSFTHDQLVTNESL